MRVILAVSILRVANALLDLAIRIAPKPVEPRPVCLWSTMGDEEIATMRNGDILSAAFRGVGGV